MFIVPCQEKHEYRVHFKTYVLQCDLIRGHDGPHEWLGGDRSVEWTNHDED